ncbi:MAG: NUDIX hydrolase [Mycobacteriaceae bacterium]|nr:NUDIX hydrolase [Mycobacteriaceae bacterium]
MRDLREGRTQPVAARPAATVVVARDDAEHGLQVFLQRRVASMAFAPGAYVFPGGSVDPRDSEPGVGWAGPAPGEWAAALGADEALARELVCAAVRETFEEAHVLLAGPTPDRVVADIAGPDWAADREALLDRGSSLAEFLRRRGLVLRADLLRPWAHWITPEIESRRFDTRFFVAAMPSGQRAGELSTMESDRAVWVRPADAVAHAQRGQWHLLPPTVATLGELARYGTVAEVLAADREIVVVQPRAEIIGGEAYLVL